MNRSQQLDFARATRDAQISGLRVKPRVVLLLQAVDRLALDAIAAGGDAFWDDGQVLAARLSIPSLSAATGKSSDTVRRAIGDAVETPYLDEEPETGRASVFWMHWPRIISDSQKVRGVSQTICEGSQVKVRGVAEKSARGSTPKTPIKWHPSHHPSQFPLDHEEQIKLIPEIPVPDLEQGAESCGGLHHAICDPPQVCGAGGGSQRGVEGHGLRVKGQNVPWPLTLTPQPFFAPELSDLLPWQRLTDELLVTLEPTMLAVLYAEAVARDWIRDTHDNRRRFLAIAFHCARHRRIESGQRRMFFVGRIKKHNSKGLMDQAWQWAAEQLDAENARGLGRQLTAAVSAKLPGVR